MSKRPRLTAAQRNLVTAFTGLAGEAALAGDSRALPACRANWPGGQPCRFRKARLKALADS